MKHPNSKKITIFRAGSFINDAQTQAQEFMALSKKSIGSYFVGNGSKGIGSGLEFAEIDVLLPLVLDLPKEDRTFREKVRQYFTEIVTRIPHGKGLELEIGLTLRNDQPLTFTDDKGLQNLPINVDDYLRYRHAIKHPRVAPNKDQALGNMLMEYYVFDKDAVLSQNVNIALLQDKALTMYLELKEKEDKMDMMLTLLLDDPRKYTGKNALSLKSQALRSFADKQADLFVTTYETDNFEQKYQIQSMINTGVIKKIGTQYVEAENGNIIGHTLEETIYYLRDETKSQQVNILKAQMQESLKGSAARTRIKPAVEA